MKKKVTTIVLLVAVAFIWGLIIKMIIDAYSAPDEESAVLPVTTVKTALVDYTQKKDTSKLLTNYRDPFGFFKKKVDTDGVRVSTRRLTSATVAIRVSKTGPDWSAIRYSGFITEPGSKKVISLLTVNGNNLMLVEGETSGGIRVIKNMRDSVKVSYMNKIKYISRAAGS